MSGGTYARVQVNAWDVPASGHTQNTNIIAWPTATTVQGTVAAVGIFDAETNGNLLMWGADEVLTNDIDPGDVYSIAAGLLDISLTGNYGYYLANALLSHILRNSAYSKPTDIKIHLYSTLPNAADSGGVELSGGAYAAISVFGATDWDDHGDGTTENTNLEVYATATADWSEAVGACLRDQSGNLLFVKTLDSPITIYNGDLFRWPVGSFDVAIR
jgi:hypothetical protein